MNRLCDNNNNNKVYCHELKTNTLNSFTKNML
jgi:hypothetical protein